MKTAWLALVLLLLFSLNLSAGGKGGIGVHQVSGRLSIQVKNFEKREIVFLMIDGKTISSASIIGETVYFEAASNAPCMSTFTLNSKDGSLSIRVLMKSAGIGEKDILIKRTSDLEYEWQEE